MGSTMCVVSDMLSSYLVSSYLSRRQHNLALASSNTPLDIIGSKAYGWDSAGIRISGHGTIVTQYHP